MLYIFHSRREAEWYQRGFNGQRLKHGYKVVWFWFNRSRRAWTKIRLVFDSGEAGYGTELEINRDRESGWFPGYPDDLLAWRFKDPKRQPT